jgi:hypothetical protein
LQYSIDIRLSIAFGNQVNCVAKRRPCCASVRRSPYDGKPSSLCTLCSVGSTVASFCVHFRRVFLLVWLMGLCLCCMASLAHGFVAHGFVFSSWCWPHACSSSRRIHASMHTATMLSSVSLQHVAMFILQMRRTPTQITILTVFGCSPDRLALPVTPLHAHSHLASVENCSLHAHVTPRTQSFGECGRLLR